MCGKDICEAVTGIKRLPTLPSVLTQILTTAADPDSSALDLGRHISRDPSLSATLLRIANSAYYGFPRTIESITTAIVMLGFFEIRNLTLTATAFRSLTGGKTDYDRTQLWRHSLATAMAAERLARIAALKHEGAFTAGLLHDIGKVALDTLFPERFRKAVQLAHDEGRFLRHGETKVFGYDHTRVGALLGEHWDLPPSIVESILYHHDSGACTVDPSLTCLVAAANYATYGAGLGESGNGREPEFPLAAAQALDLTEEHIDKVAHSLAEREDRINEFIGAMAPAS